MSTRANIVLKESWKDYEGTTQTRKLFFYRHSDGYPEGTMPTLKIFRDWMASGKIRNNLQQAAGWLIILGAIEYATIPKYEVEKVGEYSKAGIMDNLPEPEYWKAGAYEPTYCIHGDIEYLYVIDLNKKEIKCYQNWTEEGEGKGTPVNIKKQLA